MMPRHENHNTPKIVSGILYTDDTFTGTHLGSPAWFEWLATAHTFYYESRPDETFTAHLERRQRGGLYWVAYRRRAGILRRTYLGKTPQLTPDHLYAVALALSLPVNKELPIP